MDGVVRFNSLFPFPDSEPEDYLADRIALVVVVAITMRTPNMIWSIKSTAGVSILSHTINIEFSNYARVEVSAEARSLQSDMNLTTEATITAGNGFRGGLIAMSIHTTLEGGYLLARIVEVLPSPLSNSRREGS